MNVTKPFNLEERTYLFASDVRKIVKNLPKNMANFEDGKQLVRSSGSVGANYIEANEALSKKDFMHRVKIARKEAKESAYFIRLIRDSNNEYERELLILYNEAIELKKILSSIIERSK